MVASSFGGDKRDRTADLLNAIAPEVLDSVEVMKKVRQNRTKWTFPSPFRFNWYMVFCPDSGTTPVRSVPRKFKVFRGHRNLVLKKSVERKTIMSYITVQEAAKKWGISERLVRRYCAEGRMVASLLMVISRSPHNSRIRFLTAVTVSMLSLLQISCL